MKAVIRWTACIIGGGCAMALAHQLLGATIDVLSWRGLAGALLYSFVGIVNWNWR